MLFDVVDFFDKYKINYFLHYGTLLGLLRNESLIPWTIDMDLAIDFKRKGSSAK